MTLTLRDDADVPTSGLVTLKAKQASTTDMFAKLVVDPSATFVPDSLMLHGFTHATKSHAIFDVGELVTVDNDVKVRQYGDIVVASGETLDIGDNTNNDGDLLIGSVASTYWGFLTLSGPGTTEADRMVIEAYSTSDSTAKLTAGTLDVNGEVQLIGSLTTDNAIAKMEVSSGATFTPNSLNLDGGDEEAKKALLDFRANVTVQTSTGTSVDGFVDFDLAASVVFDADAMALVDSSTDLVVSGAHWYRAGDVKTFPSLSSVTDVGSSIPVV